MKRAIVLLFFILLPTAIIASPAHKKVRALISQQGDTHYPSHLGVIVEKISNHNILFSHNAKEFFPPASLQKLLTAAAAILYLKPNFTFKTALLTRGTINKHTLNGNLVIKFSGDPSLTADNLKGLLQSLQALHIKRITGHVIIDTSCFDKSYYPDGITWQDLSYSYGAPTAAVILDDNQFSLTIKPTKTGHFAQLKLQQPIPAIRLQSDVITLAKTGDKDSLKVISNGLGHYILHGHIHQAETVDLALRNPISQVKILIKDTLNHLNIIYPHHIQQGRSKQKERVLSRYQSPPLDKLIVHMLKTSDNLYANALLKTLGHRYFREPGSWANGIKALEFILKPYTQINFADTNINDGSGLSRYNLIQPQQLLQLLIAINKNPLLQRYILPALPIAGVDGTLATRMTSLGKQQRLRAKTGTMTGVANLAGFIHSRHYGLLAFVLMNDGFIVKAKKIEEFENTLCTYIALN